MNAPESPDPFSAPPARRFRGSRASWWAQLLLLSAYPVGMALLSGNAAGESGEAALSPALPRLLLVVGIELGFFGVWFGLAWWMTGASCERLMLRWKRPFFSVLLGFGYSIGLRFGVAIGMLAALAAVSLFGGGSLSEVAENLQPDIGKVVDTDQLGEDPVYLLVNCSLVSFVMAGLREELWRAGMIAGLFALFPRLDSSVGGRFFSVALAALLFGLGHAVQGWGGVWMTFLLGLGLGGIIVFHRSIWEAVMAHGFFNAASFALIFVLKRYFPEGVPGL